MNVHTAISRKSVDQVAALLPDVVARHGFGTLGSTDLRRKMNEKGVEFAHDCRVFDVCNPKQAKAVLDGEMAVSTVLPCRISVYEEDGKTVLAAASPTALLALFERADLEAPALQVERTLKAIIDEAASA